MTEPSSRPQGREAPPGRARTLADVGEEGLLEAIFPFFEPGPSDLLGPGDDAAVVAARSGSLVATTDTLVRGRDWRDEWSTASDVGAKAVTQNVADVAAMGAVPVTLLVTLVADPATPVRWAVDLARSLAETAAEAGSSVIGGDLSSAGPGTVVVTVTALGDLQGRPPVRRSGARHGDVVAVSGPLGTSDAGWRLLRQGVLESPPGEEDGVVAHLLARHRRPVAPIRQGPIAADAGATSMIDISDGLVRDGGRVARASGVSIDLEAVALAPDIDLIAPVLGRETATKSVLAGGEEHSLLATFPGEPPDGWRQVGRVTPGAGVTVDGREPDVLGWDHFGG